MALLIASLVASGCSGHFEHNDVMLFGTTTKVAFDVSSPPENGGIPQVTLGYKRNEFVLMPLYVNAKGSKLDAPSEIDLEKAKYVAQNGNSGVAKEKDIYSVLASFGTDFKGDASAEGSSGKVGLAQYFATGIAARELAESGGDLVNIQAPSQEAIQSAEKRAETAERTLRQFEVLAQERAKGAERARVLGAKRTLILAHVAPNQQLDQAKLRALVEDTKTLNDETIGATIVHAQSTADLIEILRVSDTAVDELFIALRKLE